jgi:hypothetical protein
MARGEQPEAVRRTQCRSNTSAILARLLGFQSQLAAEVM